MSKGKPKPSINEMAGKIVGKRPSGVPFDLPGSLGYHCPVCEYSLKYDGEYDERLYWSEYNGFLWCNTCNKDYPSSFCRPDDIDKAIETYLSCVHDAQMHRLDQEMPDLRILKRASAEVARYYGVSESRVRSKSRLRKYVIPRQVGMYLTRRLTSLSRNVVAAHYEKVNPSTVLFAEAQIKKRMTDDPALKEAMRAIGLRLKPIL